MKRALICSIEGISVSGMRIQSYALLRHLRPQIVRAVLLLAVLQTFLLPPARLDIFGSVALSEAVGASLHSGAAGAASTLSRTCRYRIRTCLSRLVPGHARKTFHVGSIAIGAARLYAAARPAEPPRLRGVAPLPPPTPPPRLPL